MNDQTRDEAEAQPAAPDAHICLRPWDRKDAAGLVQHADNPRIAATLRDGFPSPYTLTDANRFIAMASRPASGLLLAIDQDGVAVGGIGITPLKDVYKQTAEIGYWLAEPFWERASLPVRSPPSSRWRLSHFDIVRLQAGVFANNPASMRVLEKCGFVREAVHQNAITKNGIVMDEVVYVRFREKRDW